MINVLKKFFSAQKIKVIAFVLLGAFFMFAEQSAFADFGTCSQWGVSENSACVSGGRPIHDDWGMNHFYPCYGTSANNSCVYYNCNGECVCGLPSNKPSDCPSSCTDQCSGDVACTSGVGSGYRKCSVGSSGCKELSSTCTITSCSGCYKLSGGSCVQKSCSGSYCTTINTSSCTCGPGTCPSGGSDSTGTYTYTKSGSCDAPS